MRNLEIISYNFLFVVSADFKRVLLLHTCTLDIEPTSGRQNDS